MFTEIKKEKIEEINCTLTELQHECGARVIHLGNDDKENLFCLALQTTPSTSNGVAHILEHTVLCGSEKYPVRDPFFAMTRRSLNTYMNALTGSDFTCYPAASQIPKDFYNLLDVYLDAVFHPKLEEMSFRQEGHRLEFREPKNPESNLEYRGIVFNEMKGALTSPASRLHEAVYRELYPTLTYGVNSGGDPKEIPCLTYRELLEFHRKFYCPARCIFFFYGDIPLERHLEYLEEGILKNAAKVAPLPRLPKEKRLKEPKRTLCRYPISKEEPAEEKSYIAFGWLTCGILEQQTLLGLMILTTYLMDTDASPLKMELLKSGLCKVPSAYLDPDVSEVPVIVVLKGCRKENGGKAEEVLMEALKKIAQEGIPDEAIENVLHQLEFHRSEITGDHGPFGLSLFMRAVLPAQHGAPAEEGLKIHSLFSSLRERLKKEPDYFSRLLQEYFIDNPHFVRVDMVPDPDLEGEELKEELEKLQKIKTGLSEEEKMKIVRETEKLAEEQEEKAEESLDILPKVGLEDVPKEAQDFLLNETRAGPLRIFHHDCFTNGIVYADLSWEMPDFSEEELWLVRLFGHLLTQIGTGGRSYKETLEYQQAHTGGIFLSLAMNPQAEDPARHIPTLHLKGKALYRKADKLFRLLSETAASPDFQDKERIAEILSKHFANMQSSIAAAAMKYAINLSSSGLNVPCRLNEHWFGLEYYHRLKKAVEEGPDALIPKLLSLRERLLCLEEPHLILSCSGNEMEKWLKEGFYGLDELPAKPFDRWRGELALPKIEPQGRVIASPVAFTGKALSTTSYADPETPALSITANLLENLTLHRELREQGGAYGGGATCNALGGTFIFYAYRDPNVFSSISSFEKAVEWIARGEFAEEDLHAAILEKIQSLDSPVSPGGRADAAYSFLREGRTLEKRQKFREKLLVLNKEEVAEACRKHLLPKVKEAPSVVFAGRELLERENKKFAAVGKKPLKIEQV